MSRKMKSEEDMSMDEILSSIRTLIAEDKNVYSMQSTFGKPVEESTNPAGARSLADIPVFDNTDTFAEGVSSVTRSVSRGDELPSSAFAPLDQVVFEPVLEESSLEKQRNFSESVRSVMEEVKEDRDIFSIPVMRQEAAETQNQERSSSIRNIVQSHASDPMDFVSKESLSEGPDNGELEGLIEKLVLQRVEGVLEKKIDTIVEKIITKKLGALLSKV